ncbi:aspartate--tRNA(Asn) ligase [Clostridium polynesiense]|uniref:aspartate--tRNA(Asn) ligase n=1 Tax=Clostridium polynesiense TaxID=1325933 RepID=UPI000590CB0E|nr:aspartate--tRNA(Asn) ligase [Clostridium polynesiense]
MKRILINDLESYIGEKILIKGWVHRIRKLSRVSFLIIRDRTGFVQVIFDNDSFNIKNIKNEAVVSIYGKAAEGKNKYGNVEIQGEELDIIQGVTEDLPLDINKDSLEANLETQLNNRVLSLRHIKNNSIFKVQALIAQGFQEFLTNEGFTQVFTPKIVGGGAEGGTAIFPVKYFENTAYLAQSPQFYKQMLVAAGYERVSEIAAVYRAEEHNTSRHLNEYISLDLEMGFIEDEREVMELEEKLLRYIFKKLKKEGKEYLDILGVSVPKVPEKIPFMPLKEALNILKNKYGKEHLDGDLDPEGEKLISQYAREKFSSEFLFLTHYPSKKRPMYTMPQGEESTHSFDLLFRGLEITTGGQRIHDYSMLVESMIKKGLKPEDFNYYTEIFKYGVPPHGGLAIGLERLTSQLLGLKNVREASLLPRDRTRIMP